MDQAGAALYGLPPALAVQGFHVGLGHHHFGAGGTDARLVLRLHRPAEESTGKRGGGHGRHSARLHVQPRRRDVTCLRTPEFDLMESEYVLVNKWQDIAVQFEHTYVLLNIYYLEKNVCAN